MTTREFLNAVISSTENTEMIEKAQTMLVALDNRASSRKSKPSKVQIANEPIKARIVEILCNADEPLTSPQICEIIDDESISHNKVSALLRQIEEVDSCEIKVPKKGKMKAYFIDKTEG